MKEIKQQLLWLFVSKDVLVELQKETPLLLHSLFMDLKAQTKVSTPKVPM